MSEPNVTVVICAYTLDRWKLLCASVESVFQQTTAASEIILCIDHNRELFERCRAQWADAGSSPTRPPITIVENRYAGRLGSARTTAVELATGDVLAFLDDDAVADPEWLGRLVSAFVDPAVIAAGGAPLPVFARPRPRWFPFECDWVFGCAYLGLPTTTSPILRVIGANMAVRKQELLGVGCFHSDNHDDMDMCHRLLDGFPGTRIMYEPSAIVRHYVPASRLTWSYFWRRCFFVNRGKVRAFRGMGKASNMAAERRFARRALTHGLVTGVGQFVRGDVGGLLRALALCASLGFASSGYAAGTVEWLVSDHMGRGLSR